MRKFADINEVEEWLEPMEYEVFWLSVVPYDLVLQPKDHCDRQIAAGEVDEKLVLDVLKYFARVEMTKRYNLAWREPLFCSNLFQ